MTARTDRTLALLAGCGLALVLIVCSAVQVAAWSVGSVERSAHRVIPGPVRELRLDGGPSADIMVVPASGSDVTIDSSSRGRLSTPTVSTSVEGTAVRVSGGC